MSPLQSARKAQLAFPAPKVLCLVLLTGGGLVSSAIANSAASLLACQGTASKLTVIKPLVLPVISLH